MPWDPSLERDEPGGVGSTDTRPSVLDGLVTDGEFSKMSPDRLRLLTSSLRLPSAGAGGEELDEVVGGHVEERVEVHAAVAVLAERPLLGLPRGGDLRLDVDVRVRGTITRGEGLVSSATAKCVRVVDSRAGRGCELWPLTMAAVGLEERRGRGAEARRGSGGGGGVLGFAGRGVAAGIISGVLIRLGMGRWNFRSPSTSDHLRKGAHTV
ncbi:unnamed protein product [Miscanthus lutarioriparius]|uniref:Uncharacterized protein n=1 Tax=Miscanthus lutarioriparius TaxID=422564 RepID=A0A811RW19_9POAL|nr:unnamed protein product [Miscanthus lutarioriparius]